MLKPPKFKVNDHVRIIKYGSLTWFDIMPDITQSGKGMKYIKSELEVHYYDICPEWVGTQAKVKEVVEDTNGNATYRLTGYGNQIFQEEQLEVLVMSSGEWATGIMIFAFSVAMIGLGHQADSFWCKAVGFSVIQFTLGFFSGKYSQLRD